MKSLLLLLPFLCVTVSVLAQPGCQDPQATNFNPSATSSDASCNYPVTNWSLTNRIAALPATIDETSALLITDGKMFTINDSGNEPKLYQIDTTSGTILKATTISNFSNVDWEDLTADSTYIYIGDVGNNDGERTNLRFLRVKKSVIYDMDSTSVSAEAIRFSYPDQTSFAPSTTHNFDCEGFFYLGGRLHLFSKNRGDKKTKHYSLPAIPGTHLAILHDSLNVNGLITGASVRADGKIAVLIGYDQSNLKVFSWILFGYPDADFFAANRRRLELPNMLTSGQVEGIGFVDQFRLWVSNETLGPVVAKVKQMDIRTLTQPFFLPVASILESNRFKVFPNPAQSFFEIESPVYGEVSVYNAVGLHVMNLDLNGRKSISTEKWPEGLYILRFQSRIGADMEIARLVVNH